MSDKLFVYIDNNGKKPRILISSANIKKEKFVELIMFHSNNEKALAVIAKAFCLGFVTAVQLSFDSIQNEPEEFSI